MCVAFPCGHKLNMNLYYVKYVCSLLTDNFKFLPTFSEQVEVVIEYDLFTLCLLHHL